MTATATEQPFYRNGSCRFHVNDKTSCHHLVTALRTKYRGGRDVPAKTSEVRCVITGACWRTGAQYVDRCKVVSGREWRNRRRRYLGLPEGG